MKKLFASLLFASSLCLTACGASESSGSVKSKLAGSGYSTTVYTAEQAKERYKGFTFEGFELVDAVYGTKGEGDNLDFLLAFFFGNADQASSFVTTGDNIRLFDSAKEELGKNLVGKYGSHNNVAYVGSQTSFSVAF